MPLIIQSSFLLIVAVIVFSSSAQAQTWEDLDLPPNFKEMPPKEYWLITSDLDGKAKQVVLDNEDHIIYYNGGVFDIIVRKPPTERYTRERLWNEYFPVFKQIERLHMKGLSRVIAYFYFEGVFSRRGELTFGSPEPSDLFFSFASAKFNLEGKIVFGNYSLETFGPIILGMAGHKNHGETFSWRAVGYPPDAKLLAAQYDDFPRHTYLDSMVYGIKSIKLYKLMKEREDKNFWNAFIGGLADGGVIDQVQCANIAREGRSIPWYCEESDYNKSRGK